MFPGLTRYEQEERQKARGKTVAARLRPEFCAEGDRPLNSPSISNGVCAGSQSCSIHAAHWLVPPIFPVVRVQRDDRARVEV